MADPPGVDTVTVLVCDDHPVVRAGIVGLLASEPGIEVVGEAGDGAEAVMQAARLRPDVVLMDLRMPRVDGSVATARILAERPDTAVVVLTTYETDTDILRAVEAGARGYLLKDTPGEDIADAVRAAARGETVLAPAVAARLMSRVRKPSTVALTSREIEVLHGVAMGWSNPEIARRLVIAEATVKTHLLRTFQKLGVDDRTRAVTVAMELGILRMP